MMNKTKLLFLILLTVLSISINGYQFGEADHKIIIPFIKKINEPALYNENDILINQLPNYPSRFIYLMAYLSRLMGMETAFLSVFVLTRFLFYLAVFELAEYAFNRNAAVVTTILMLTSKPALSTNFMETLLLARSFALPFLLFSILLFLKEKEYLAFATLGVMANFHSTSTFLVLFIFLFYFLLNSEAATYKTAICLAEFLILASPILINTQNIPFFASSEWINILKITSSVHIFPFSWGSTSWLLFLTIPVLLAVSFKHKPDAHYKFVSFFLAILLLCFAGIFFTEFVPLSGVIILQPFRSTQLFTIFAMMYIVNYLLKEIPKGYFIKSFVCFNILVVLLLYPLAYQPRQTDNIQWKDAQLWARHNTPKDAMFLTPVGISGFRVWSERSTALELKDGALSHYDPKYAKQWQSRLKNLNEVDADYIITEKPKELGYKKVYENQQFNVFIIDIG